MKKNWLRKFSAAICAATLFTSGFAMTVNAANSYTVTPFTAANFDDLTGDDLEINDKTKGYITVSKYITENQSQNGDPTTAVKPEVPVRGVEFTLVKVGRYANVVAPDGTASTMIGMDKDFVDIVLDGDSAFFQPYIEDADGFVYMTSALYNTFNDAMEDKGNDLAQTLENSTWWDGLTDTDKVTKFTDDNGTTTFEYKSGEFGIYVVVETDVLNAQKEVGKDKWENVLFSKKQYPYIVSLPYTTQGTDAKWSSEVIAKAKNTETTVDVEKKIERKSSSLTRQRNNQYDTDVTHVGDTVEFTLITDVPMIEAHEGVESYVITDEVSNGITLPAMFTPDNISISDSKDQKYEFAIDYRVKPHTPVNSSPYVNGFSIEFTESGRTKLANAAHETSGDQKVYTSYIASINKDAVVGTTGNPNRVKLDLQAAGSGEITTDWDDVKEFIFSMEGNKTFDAAQNNGLADNVKFELYLDNPEINDEAKPLTLIKNEKGLYTYVEPKNLDDLPEDYETTKEIELSESSFSIKGVPVYNEEDVTLYLKETATAPGYNKLTRVVPVTLTATTVKVEQLDEYDGILAGGTVNSKNAQIIAVNGEGVAVTTGQTGSNSGISFTVNNTKGFQLPSTGGMGIWMFVIGGMAVIGCGLLYYRKNAKSAK